MKRPLTSVSDHAVLRYIERVMGYDVERLRGEIGRAVDGAVRAGACSVTIEGFEFRIADGVVATVCRRKQSQRTRHCRPEESA